MHPTTAFVFPGQGSQYIGMLNNCDKKREIILEIFNEASDSLGYNLWDLIQQGPLEKLNQTEFTQPALLTAGVAMWRHWQATADGQPIILAGHSLGEYTALVCANALDLTAAVQLVAKRGQLMQSVTVVGGGAMAAILGLPDHDVAAVCAMGAALSGEVVQPVNFNAPGQVVIAGTNAAVKAAMNIAKDKGAKKTVLLPISVPSHCELMQPIAEQFASELAAIKWQLPTIPVVHNFDVLVHKDIASICNALTQQLYQPVRWVETIQYMASIGVDLVAECGPGRVLTGLNKRICNNLRCIALEKESI